MKTLAIPATAAGFAAERQSVLVGRKVANSEFLKALVRHSSFDRFLFLVGEATEERFLREALVDGGIVDEERLAIRNLRELPRLLAEDEIDVIHNGSHIEGFLDYVWHRDRHARRHVPVTGHIFSLSYPRMMNNYLRFALIEPGPGDAIICCSEIGKRVVNECVGALSDSLEAAGRGRLALNCPMPVIPFGVDVTRLAFGDRRGLREQHGIPEEALVILGMGRFTEYDKMDLFPLIQVLPRLVAEGDRLGRPVVLLLAGASQGVGTVELLQRWAKILGVAGRVLFVVNFPEEQKPDLLAAADLFVSPCDNPQETFGLSVVEAMAAGLPVVVSDFNGYRETAVDGVGARVPTTWGGEWEALDDLGPLLYERPLHLIFGQSVAVDLGALEATVLGLLGDERLRSALGGAGARRAREVYDWSQVIAEHEALWEELATKGAARDEGKAPHPLRMPVRRVFGHYPTRWLDDAQELGLTPFALWLRKNGVQHPIYREIQGVVSEAMVATLVAELDEPRSVGSLREELRTRFPDEESQVAPASIVWMLKHGLLG